MSTAYQPAMPTFEGRTLSGYPSALSHSSHIKPVVDDARSSHQYRYASQQVQLRNGPYLSTEPAADPMLRQPPSSLTPVTESSVAAKRSHSTTPRRGSETLIYHSLQMPKCISHTGGNLSDFAAQMTCLFWFESIDELKKAESIRSRQPNASIQRLPALAKPHEQFRKWVYNVLSTTQVTQNVILLALLFIYRLKMSTPQIKGRAGSEYRLLTVALMLGNKFLDDNTYTNKTWAEVSCFAVQEIHVMEVEFLSNMRYNLLASKEEWEQWIVKLSCFHDYYERASNLPVSPVHIPSPSHKALYSPLPSPTGTGIPPFTPSTKFNLSPSSRHCQNVSAYQSNATSPLASKISIPVPSSRKRSPDEDLTEHPAKRMVHSAAAQIVQGASSTRLNGHVDSTRLPVPHLTVVTSHSPDQFATGQNFSSQGSVPSASQQVVSLPPLQSGVRAMSTVYQTGTPSAVALQPQSVSASSSSAITGSTYPITGLPIHPQVPYGTPTKHHSPRNMAPAYGSSPLVEAFGPGSAVHTPIAHTPISNSPSVYLQHRASPYKPIRHVNRLLCPPPSASLDQYHLSVPVQPNQMHYQPLGRRHDLRTGIVPEFLVYNRGQQQHLIPHGPHQGHFTS
ncbi:Meiotically up-regulated 80 protein [Metarhizium brunneum]|uniref:Meiotically up-regulated 80 protein n=1 Tax=Metarhizium brunneum TaxID=500148 RepID=A0A7D5YPP4_9HYPO|nr:Meiotically up-regulated 80 protein [Metarhizium brunneum]